MRSFRPFLLLLILLFPLIALHAAQDVPRLEITGVNASQMPVVTVTANVYDNVGQPVRGLTTADFTLTGDLVGLATITSVENITDNNLPFAVVLAIDISTSMDGNPLDAAKRAARAFIENLGPNDPVAIVTFATGVQVVQDYTTDKVTLSAVIDSLEVAGQTALYQGAYDAIQQAASSPTPRRAVILLSDGAEYGGNSQVGRAAAVSEALVRGVPVYTIGLGFGADRTYLEQLSTSTNARMYESPGADELTQIYTDLAARLRSQYVVTLDVPLALDGTQYNLGLQVNTPQGSTSATAVLRAPIPVPIVRLPELTEPLSETTDVTATVLADDPITGVTFAVNGGESQTFSEAPYTFTIDPVEYAPDSYVLTASATDDDGDTGSGAIPFTVAALPSQITLSPALSSLGAIAEPQTITVETSGQTATTDVSVDLGDGATELSERNTFTIDPIQFSPGANSVAVTVTNEGGVTSTETVPFTVAAIPPQVSIIGVQDGQSVGEPVSFSVSVTAQETVSEISAMVDDTALQPDADGTYTIDPMAFEPGGQTLTVTATAGGRSGSASVNFVVAALPPVITVDGLSAGDVVSADRAVNFAFVSQTPVIHVAVFVDGADLAHLVRAPFGVTINVLDYAPADHLMRVIADNASGGSSTLDIPFSIAPEPAATATATTILATQAAQVSQTAAAELLAQQASATATAIQATQAAQATGTQIANASETFVARMSTQAAQASATATAVQATQAAQATATLVAQVSQTAAAQASATQVAQATQSAVDATATQTAREATATQVALSTQNAALAATATQLIREATATSGAATTATQAAQLTATSVRGTQTALNAAATQAAQSTQVAQAMLDAAATQNAAATLAAEATKLVSGATATQVAFVTLDAQASATAAQQALLDATGDAKSTQQAITEATGTAVVSLNLSTQVALEQTSTQAAVSTQSALDSSATQVALDTAVTQTAQVTQTAAEATAAQATQAAQNTQSVRATSTQVAQATQAAQATVRAAALAQAQAATRSALSTAAAEGRLSAQATQDARATRNSVATATQSANATATADQATQDTLGLTATQVIRNATATEAAQSTLDALATQTVLDATITVEHVTQAALSTISALEVTATQRVIDATATRAVLETQTALNAAGTQAALDASATPAAEATNAAQSTQVAQVAAATAERSGQQTATSQVLADSATSTAAANATQRAEILATDAQATVSAGATETADALGTLETRQTAIGPTATPVEGGAQGAPSETPPPSPTLTEVQAQEPPASSDVAPILIVVIVVIVIILVLVLIMRGRGSPIGR